MAKDKRVNDRRKTRKRKGPTTAEFFEEWLASISHSVKPTTLLRYEESVRIHATPVFGDVRLTRLSPSDLERLYGSKIREGLTPKSVWNLHMVLHRALSYAQRRGLVENNVAKLVDPPKRQRREMQSLSPEQARRFLAAPGRVAWSSVA